MSKKREYDPMSDPTNSSYKGRVPTRFSDWPAYVGELRRDLEVREGNYLSITPNKNSFEDYRLR